MRTGHTVYPNGIISCAMPEEYHGRSSCTLQEVLKSTLCSDNAIDECPEVLAVAFSNMYQEAGDDWWCDVEITDVDAALDSLACARNAPPEVDATYKARAITIHRHSGPARRSRTAGHYIAQFVENGVWYVADDTYVHKCEPLRSLQGSVLFPYVFFQTKNTMDAQDVDPMTCEDHVDDFAAKQLEAAPHLELDAVSLRGLDEAERLELSDGVAAILEGVQFESLPRQQRKVLQMCSPVLEAPGVIDSDSELDMGDDRSNASDLPDGCRDADRTHAGVDADSSVAPRALEDAADSSSSKAATLSSSSSPKTPHKALGTLEGYGFTRKPAKRDGDCECARGSQADQHLPDCS